MPADGSISGWRKRRWHCDQPGCGRKTFTEAVEQVPARARLTDRLRRAAGAAVADAGRTIVQSARDHGLSWPVVSAAFTEYAAAVLPEQPEPVSVLGDRRDPPGTSTMDMERQEPVLGDRGGPVHVGFVDLAGGQGLLGQVEGRTSTVVKDWLGQRDEDWHHGVRFVAIDMCTIFKAAIRDALPQARPVVDHSIRCSWPTRP